jgi:LacI family transcriptional regulator
VSKEKRQEILRVAAELNYHVDHVARALRRQKANTIGFFITDSYLGADNGFLDEIVSGVQFACSEADFDLLIQTAHRNTTEENIRSRLAGGRVDGLIFFAPNQEELSAVLVKTGLPLISIVDAIPEIPTVRIDDRKGGALQAEYVYAKGHRKVLYRGIQREPDSVRLRRESFLARASELGIDVRRAQPIRLYERTEFSPDDLASLRQGTTAIVCWEDTTAHESGLYLEALGFQIPRDFELVGYNGCIARIPPKFRIPTVICPWRHVGLEAVRLLLGALDGEPLVSSTLPVFFSDNPFKDAWNHINVETHELGQLKHAPEEPNAG